MARPQPVTATVTKPEWMKVQATRHRSFSFDSTGSTASLVSVLDHDSYVESDSEIQEAAVPNTPNDQPQDDVQNDFFEDYTHNTYSKDESENLDRADCQETSIANSWSITPWEKWLVEKEKQKRDLIEKERAKKTLDEVAQIDIEQLKKQKKIQESKNTHRWIQEKNLAEKLRSRQQRETLKSAMREETRKKNEISEKANRNFTEWLQKKKEKEKAAAKAEVERKHEKEESKKKKEILAKEKYDEWIKRAAKTPVKPTTVGLGYLSAKLSDLNDPTAYPPPSYFNPIPWKPLPIPRTKMEKKLKSSKSFTARK